MDDSELDDQKLGEGDLRDRAALGRLPQVSPTEAARTERSAAEVLYPERSIRSQPHSKEGAAPLPAGAPAPAPAPADITLAALADVIARDTGLDQRRRSHLLAYVNALSSYIETLRAGRR